MDAGSITNQEMLAINQDPLGQPGKRLFQNGRVEVWLRDLADGTKAIALFNRGDADTVISMAPVVQALPETWKARDVWKGTYLGDLSAINELSVPKHGSILLMLNQVADRTWNSSNPLTGETDVLADSSTSATVLAYVPNSASATTVNGISFTNNLTQGGITLGVTGTGDGSGTDIANQMDGVTSIGGSPPYATMLGSASYYYANPGSTATQTLSLSGLRNNQNYQIRLWAADYRPDQSGRTETIGGLTLDYDDSFGSHSGGNYVIGTFAADGTPQAFTLTSGAGSPYGYPSAQFNAFQLATIPGSFRLGDVATVTGGTDWSAPTSSGATATLSGSGNVSGGNVTINSDCTLEFTGAATLGSGNFSGNFSTSGTLSMASSADQTLSGSITGSGALTKSGSGTLTLTGTNTYGGTTTISGGTLVLADDAQLKFVVTRGQSKLLHRHRNRHLERRFLHRHFRSHRHHRPHLAARGQGEPRSRIVLHLHLHRDRLHRPGGRRHLDHDRCQRQLVF